MRSVLKQNLFFLIPYFIFLAFTGIVLTLYSKGEVHLFINRFHANIFDHFFFYATFLGDGITVVVIVLLLCLVKYKYALLTGLSNIASSLITQSLKHTIFSEVDRPRKYFEGVADLNLVPWVENYVHNSFPSGHTTAAFTTYFCLALVSKNKWVKASMFLVAMTIGFSRVYLSQHFISDVYAGSVIGVGMSLLAYMVIFHPGYAERARWMERSLLKR